MCGIFAIFNNKYNKNLQELFYSLQRLQHRGKDGYGIVYFYDNSSLITTKGAGELNDNILERMNNIQSKSCMGHLRYSTSGSTIKNGLLKRTELQPIRGFDEYSEGPFYLAHNGNIPNIENHDTTYIKNLLENNKNPMENNKNPMENKLIQLINEIPAAFSIIILTCNNVLYAVRDRFGIRPLCIGQHNNKYCISSESCAFGDNVNYLRDVKPGELIRIDEQGLHSLYIHEKSQLNLCTFEILYFLNEKSYVDGLQIKNIRKNLGKILANKEEILNKNINDYTVIGIPLTGILYGKAYAETLGINYQQLIHKNEKISRTFIILDELQRKKACNDKFFYDKNNIKDKKLIIIDDTIVRGNIIKAIIRNLKKCGALEIHVRIPAPPVIDICELGICIQNKEELIMNNKTVEEVCKEIKADSLKYLKIEDLEYFPNNSYNQCFSGYINPIIKTR
jgi:amidophosphoribosyltransferase